MRKSIIAASTAVAVSFAGISVAQAQDGSGTGSSATDNDTGQQTDLSSQYLGSSLQDTDPKEIREWIAVFTAIISALSTAFAFMDRIAR